MTIDKDLQYSATLGTAHYNSNTAHIDIASK